MSRTRLVIAMVLACAAPAASAPKPLVGVYYYPGWYRSFGEVPGPTAAYSEWRSCIMKAATPRPVCGFYNDADPRLWNNYFIPWMTSHGIDFVAFDWYYSAKQEFLYESLDRGLLQSAKCNDLKFCIHWCNHGGLWWSKSMDQSKDPVLEMTDVLCARYFHRPNYLRVNGRPVFMIYDIPNLMNDGGFDAARQTLAAMRAHAVKRGLPGLYLVGIYSGTSPEYPAMLAKLGFDAFCAYTYAALRPPSITWDSPAIPYKEQVDLLTEDLYPHQQALAKEAGISYWPTAFPGWDDRPRAGVEKGWTIIDNTPSEFGRMFGSALRNASPDSPVVMVEAWNEWGEGACIEPERKHGFGYLEEIAKALGKPAPRQQTPSAEEIAGWTVLTPEELATARENESKPWPVKSIKRAVVAESYPADPVKTPVVFDLAAGGVPAGEIELVDLRLIERTAEGMLLETTGVDSQIILPKLKVPSHQIKRITVEGKLLVVPWKEGFAPRMELFWTTGRIPGFSQFACVGMPWPAEGWPSIEMSRAPFWKSTGTPFTRLRVDPCEASGVRVLIRRVVLSS